MWIGFVLAVSAQLGNAPVRTANPLKEFMPHDEHDDHGHSLSPDYADPHLRAALVHFIAASGARYDGDPRIGFI